MKKYISVTLGFLLTLLLAGSGFFLPSFIFSYQNRQIQSKINQYPIEQTQFYYSSDFINTITLFQNLSYTMDFSEDNASSTSDEIYNSTLQVLKKMSSYGFWVPVENISSHYIRPFLAISKASSQKTSSQSKSAAADDIIGYSSAESNRSYASTAVIWNVEILFQNNVSATLFMDDQSRKMVAFMINSYSSRKDFEAFEPEHFSDYFLKFLTDYYNSEDNLYQFSLISNEDNSSCFYLMEDYSGKKAYLTFSKEEKDYLLYFNQ